MKTLEKFQLLARQALLRWRNADTRQLTVFGRGYNRLTDWLTRVTWKRFFVFCLLLIIVGGMTSGLLENLLNDDSPRPFILIQKDKPLTKILIEADADGVRVRSVEPQTAQTIKDKARTVKDAAQSVRDAAQALRDLNKTTQPAKQKGQDPKDLENTGDPPVTAIPPLPPLPPEAPEEPKEPEAPGELIAQKDGVEVRLQKNGDLSEEVDQLIEEIKSNIAKNTSDSTTEVAAVQHISRKSKRVNGGSLMQLLMIGIAGLITMKVVLNTQRKAQVKVAAAQEATEREALQRQLVEAKFTTMQAQVEPHFLFNTLASVDHLIEVDPPRASQMQKNLIQYLRAAMPHMRDTASTMGREAQLVTSYLKILQFRMEERLEFSVDIPQGLYTADIPPMMLLSMVENAIKHGLEPKPEGGRIDVKAEIVHGKLRVSVADTGLGLTPGKAATSGTGIGLANIRERLAMLYGSSAQFSITANQPAGTIAVIEIPYKLTTIPSSV